ncbi:cupin domain-containing protein [Photobacterium sp. R1]
MFILVYAVKTIQLTRIYIMNKCLLTRENIEAFEGIEKTHFLNPKAQRVNKSLGDLTGLTGIGVHLIEVQPGMLTTEFHRHYFEDECVYILEGTAEARIGKHYYSVSAGDFIGYKAGGEAHSLLNTGHTVLKCLVIGQRLPHDVADYPDLSKRIYRNQEMAWNLVDISKIEMPDAGKK